LLPQFFAPAFWPLLLLLIPLVIVYFLKLRRQRLTVPSLALWRQVVNDQRVNAPFQKFKKNLLLLLQILLLLLLVLAAMQPFFPGTESRASKLPILIDCSASMGARDATGRTRLDLVKEEVRQIIDGLQPGYELTLIELGASARRVTEFTDNKIILRKALDDLQVADVGSRLEDGLRLAQALTRSTDQIEAVRLYTDGNLPTRLNRATGLPVAAVDFDLSFPVEFFQIPPAGPNAGITSLNARRSATDRWDVFVRVEASSTGGAEGKLTLKSNGEFVGEERLVLNPAEAQRIVFNVDTRQSHELEVNWEPIGFDSLSTDNRAWLSLPPGRNLRVYCPTALTTFRHALQGLEAVTVEPTESGDTQFAEYDLVVSNLPEDAERPAAAHLLVGFIPADLQQLVEIREEPATVVDWKRDAQLLQHVQLRDVLISDLPRKANGVEDGEIERLGYEILAYGNQGPLILRKSAGPKLTYHVLFQIDRSTLPYRVGFPILLSNLVNEALQQADLGEVQAPRTGTLPPLRLAGQPASEVTVVPPAGAVSVRTTDDAGLLLGVSAPLSGLYEIRQGNNLLARVGTALLNSSETSLATVDKIQFNELAVEKSEERRTSDQLWWRQLAMAALCVLLIEWWYFQKRPAGIPET
jgi:hypothetical protein